MTEKSVTIIRDVAIFLLIWVLLPEPGLRLIVGGLWVIYRVVAYLSPAKKPKISEPSRFRPLSNVREEQAKKIRQEEERNKPVPLMQDDPRWTVPSPRHTIESLYELGGSAPFQNLINCQYDFEEWARYHPFHAQQFLTIGLGPVLSEETKNYVVRAAQDDLNLVEETK